MKGKGQYKIYESSMKISGIRVFPKWRMLGTLIIAVLGIVFLAYPLRPAGTAAAKNACPGQGYAVEALFDLDSPATGPFPSDWFTVEDPDQRTHRRVSLPLPDCGVYVSDCEDLTVINELDGFNLQPRLSVPFSGPIDPDTVTGDTLFLVSLGSTDQDQEDMPRGTVVGIDQVVWDTFTDTLHVESNELLAQHTRFALIVTRGIRDQRGAPVEASEDFQRFRANVRGEYKQALLDAMQATRHVGVREEDIVAASVFTTQSATAALEKIRDQIHAATPEPADFLLGPNNERTLFDMGDVKSITWGQQKKVNPTLTNVPVDLQLYSGDHFPGSIGSIAFGKYLSPDYRVHPGEYIPPVATGNGTPEAQGTSDIYFNLYLPSGPEPAGGWPVVIYGHGNNGNKNVPLDLVNSMAKYGIATIAINAVGHGYGSLSTLTVQRSDGGSITFSEGGRSIDQDRNGTIDSNEGMMASRPETIVLTSDGFRQTAVDLMQLVRVIEAGLDVNGDYKRDLDPSRIYYLGHSYGGSYGTVFLAVEPDVRAGVLAVPGNPVAFGAMGAFRFVVGTMLGLRQPSFFSTIPFTPGIAVYAGLGLSGPFFDDNMPLKNQIPLTVQLADLTTRVIQSPVINNVVGAMELQELTEYFEWVGQAGSPVAYAPRLQKAPLGGVLPKPVIYYMAKGDETAPNPTTTAIIRAGELADRTVYYRHDLARLDGFKIPRNPHSIVNAVSSFGLLALGAQAQAATFFSSDGTMAIQPQPARYFEFPIPLPLPENLNYMIP